MVKKSGERMKVEQDEFLVDGEKSVMMTMRRRPLTDCSSNRKGRAANSRQRPSIVSYHILRAGVQPTLDPYAEAFRPMALTQEGKSLVNGVCECVRD